MDSTTSTAPTGVRTGSRRRSRLLGAAASAAITVTAAAISLSPAAAAPAEHEVYVEDYSDTIPFAADEGLGTCVGYAGTESVTRTGSYRLVTPGTGPRSAEAKVVGRISGHGTITPADPADGPTYDGAFAEQVSGWFTGVDAEGNDTFRVVHYRLHGRLAGSDGSTLVFESEQKLTLRPDGTAVVERGSQTCTVR